MPFGRQCLRAFSVATVACMISAGGARSAAQSSAPADPEKSSPPVQVVTETVDLLLASTSGRLKVVARGHGQDRVRLTIRNTSHRRLNVVLPPGLVAVSAAGQGGGRPLQSVGLGMITNLPGNFGQFRGSTSSDGLRSVPVQDVLNDSALTVPAEESVDLLVPGVCLNFGLPAPTPRDTFTLMDVDSYTTDNRVRKSLRSLCLLGTGQRVAQAVMWRVCSDLPFEAMAAQAGKVLNDYEIALAGRFVEVLDASGEQELVDRGLLLERRLFVRIQGEGPLAADARRLNDQLEGQRLLGLPVSVPPGEEIPAASPPALSVKVFLSATKAGDTRGRIAVSYSPVAGQWNPLGKAAFQDSSSLPFSDGKALSRALDEAVASAFVIVKPARRSMGSTMLRIENHLPFTLATVKLRAGTSAGGPTVPFPGVGIGPAHSVLVPIQAATAVVESVELNGL